MNRSGRKSLIWRGEERNRKENKGKEKKERNRRKKEERRRNEFVRGLASLNQQEEILDKR